jgi:predicted dienelactone hydrolase
MAPYTDPLDDAALSAVNVPTLLITGTKDTTTPIVPMTERPWKLIAGRPLDRIDLADAGHQSFTDVCAYQKLLPTIPDVPGVLVDTVDELAEQGCPSTFLDVDRAHDVTDQFAISFLETHLAGAKGYETVLTERGAESIPEAKFSER